MEADLTKKIRNAIKEKLIELDAYVDNELPDYIMVMVANKKSKESMESDLSLFLGKNTSSFTSWLLETLEKMEDEAALEMANGSDLSCLEKDYNGSALLDDTNPADDEMLLDADLLDDDLLSKDLQEEVAVLNKLMSEKENSVPEVSKKEEPVVKPPVKQKTTYDKPSSNKSSHWTSYNDKNKVEQYDPLNPSVKSVASKVQVSERRSSVPLSLQANKLLLLKAVDDANRSIVGKQNINEIYKPTPIKVLSSPTKEEHYQFSSKRNYVRTTDTVPEEDNYVPRKRHAAETYDNRPMYNRARPNLLQIIPQSDTELHHGITYAPRRTFQISEEDIHMEEVSSEEDSFQADARSTVSPHFVVTLNGVDENTFKGKLSDDFSESSDTENVAIDSLETTIDTASDATPPSEKTLEKCRFWPSCKNGDKCPYVHPTIPCKAFPKCTFGDKCLYIHPNCKYDPHCSREDCPYTHIHKTSKAFAVSGSLLTKFSVPSESPKSVVCKFHPYCTNYHCPYLHPKKCRFGNRCHAANCPFTHPAFPARNKLTWRVTT